MSSENSDQQASGEHQQGGEAVVFEHVNSLREVKVHAGKDETLSELWDTACSELKEPRKATDRLQTEDGVDLTPFLELTLHQLREEKGIKSRRFQIVGKTGGA